MADLSELFARLGPRTAGPDPLIQPPANPAMPAAWAQNAVRGIAGSLANIGMAPRRAMDQGMTTAEAVPWAGDMALNMAGAGAPTAARGAVGVAGGKLVQPQGERIVGAAVQGADGRIFGGATHSGAAANAADYYKTTDLFGKGLLKDTALDGFLTDTGRYVTREDALRLASEAGQRGSFGSLASWGAQKGRLEASEIYDQGGDPLFKALELANAKKPPEGIRAYHGSPHDFERFDISKIGTGEGAQSYGHGLYFAENEAVAREYEKRLAAKAGYYDVDEGKYVIPDKGNMYEVNINAKPEHFLNYDARLGGQSPEVQEKIRKLAPGVTDAFHPAERVGPELAGQMREAGIPGIKYLDQGSRDLSPRIAMANRLEREIVENRAVLKDATGPVAEAIRGKISNQEKALASERAAIAEHQTTSNYVLFDDKLIDILRKYGLAGMAPAAGAAGVGAASDSRPPFGGLGGLVRD